MESCKGCGSNKLTKNGRNKLGVQRYQCQECGGVFIEGNACLKHGLQKRLKVINMYLWKGSGLDLERD